MRFFGDFPAKADAKGRVFLPAAFRKVLEAADEKRLVLRPDLYQDCLVLYPESVWNDMQDALESRLNKWDRRHQDIMRRFVAGVEKFELDGSGRFLINKRKMERAGISQDIVFLAVNDKIEVWDKTRYEEHFCDDGVLGELIEQTMAEPQTKDMS